MKQRGSFMGFALLTDWVRVKHGSHCATLFFIHWLLYNMETIWEQSYSKRILHYNVNV